MVLKVVSKINTRLKFSYRKNKFLSSQLRRLLCNTLTQPHFDYACSVWYPNKLLSSQLRRLLCNALIQPQFDYACSVWYPNLNKKFKIKLQTLQNKCVCFCLQLDNRGHVAITEFKKINWLPIDYRFRLCLASSAFKFFDDRSPLYMKDVFDKSCISQA